MINALTRDGAKLGLYARGGAKSRKRFGGGILEPTHYVDVSYRARSPEQGDQLHTLMEAQLIRGFEGLRSDFDRLQTALYFLELMSKLAQEGTIDSQDMFDLLGNGLGAAETGAGTDMEKLKLHFQIKVLGGQGVLPPLEFVEAWLRTPLRDYAKLEIKSADLRSLQWNIHHGLEAYLGGLS